MNSGCSGRSVAVAWQRLDEPEIRVRDEELGIGAPDDNGPDVVIVGQLTGELPEGADEHGVEQVDGRMVEGDERDPLVDVDSQTLVLVRAHGPPPCSGNRRTAPSLAGERAGRRVTFLAPVRRGRVYLPVGRSSRGPRP